MGAVLKDMEKLDANGHRIPFKIGYMTAVRENWIKFQKLEKQLEHLKKDSEEYKEIQSKLQKLDIGGRAVIIPKCTMTGRSKSPAGATINAADQKKQLIKDPRHWQHLTRNFRITATETRKAHWRLFMEYNNESVIF
ncbi:MAG: hypothetical protein ACEQSL_03585 [Sediminibacterium sp.]